jgi:hypothetical protein
MKKLTDWLVNKFQQPLSLVFFLFGALLTVIGVTTRIKLPGIDPLEASQSYRWPALVIGIIFILLAILIERGLFVRKPYIEEVPRQKIQAAGREYAQSCDGEMHWFNVPLGRCIPPLFDDFLKPAIANAKVTRIVFMLDQTVEPIWTRFVLPAVEQAERSPDHVRSKVTVLFHDLKNVSPVRHNMAFRMINVNSPNGRKPEAHLFFYDESWMSKIPVAGREELIPKRMVKVKPGCELFDELQMLCESYCFQAEKREA